MRILNGVLCFLLILFGAVQYNDPDGVFWAVVYGAGAWWCGAAALKPRAMRRAPAASAFIASLLAAVAGMLWLWPATPNWWSRDVWWETETAREGMGMMILVVCLLLAGVSVLRARQV